MVRGNNSEGLPLNAPFIVMGDLNVDYRDSKKRGCFVKSLLESEKIKVLKVDHIYESEGFTKNPNKLLLDYILYGGHGLSLNKEVFMVCLLVRSIWVAKIRPPMPGKVMVSYEKRGKVCFLEMNKKYFFGAKKASDHFPFMLSFPWKRNPNSRWLKDNKSYLTSENLPWLKLFSLKMCYFGAFFHLIRQHA